MHCVSYFNNVFIDNNTNSETISKNNSLTRKLPEIKFVYILLSYY